ncbi:hypothetical protein SISNIDRAFT_466727 [Sistotremastrum niveocremeum HHB9708]|uniref:Uncharacterized protein n=1 Tax=Sistotremastrum niveocremeum HHB9708 TaxID=1314777 RepID=A0A164U2S8_9AGAM|nr:hypothetical protein SISNIDRAFT_466727 [Sistotremastrum niveocremeum HHB9708]
MLALSSCSRPPIANRMQRRLAQVHSISDPSLRFQLLLKLHLDNVGDQLKSELKTMPTNHPVLVMWHQVPTPMKFLKQAKDHLLRHPPYEGSDFLSHPSKWILLRDSLIHMLLLKMEIYKEKTARPSRYLNASLGQSSNASCLPTIDEADD